MVVYRSARCAVMVIAARNTFEAAAIFLRGDVVRFSSKPWLQGRPSAAPSGNASRWGLPPTRRARRRSDSPRRGRQSIHSPPTWCMLGRCLTARIRRRCHWCIHLRFRARPRHGGWSPPKTTAQQKKAVSVDVVVSGSRVRNWSSLIMDNSPRRLSRAGSVAAKLKTVALANSISQAAASLPSSACRGGGSVRPWHASPPFKRSCHQA